MQKPNSPYNLAHIYCCESEMMILGRCLTNQEALIETYDVLTVQDFYKTEHQHIFRALSDFYERDIPLELTAIHLELQKNGNLEKCGGLSYLTNLMCYVGVSVHIQHYIKIVQSKSLSRKLLVVIDKCRSLVYKNDMTGNQILDEAYTMFMNMTTERCGSKSLKSFQFEEVESIKQRLFSEEKIKNRLSSGYSHLDNITHGIEPSRYWVMAARPGMGKTAFAMNIIENISIKQNKKALIFSLEMTFEDVMNRLISSLTCIPLQKLIASDLQLDERIKINECIDQLQQKAIFVDESSSDIISIRNRARIAVKQYKIDLIVIDYLQIIRGLNRESRQLEIAEISQILRELSKELKVPVICLSQLSRKVEQRNSFVPILSDLRDSGCIEQDADVVLLLNRPDYYNPNNRPNEMDLIVAKNRFGECGIVKFHFNKLTTRFNLLADDKKVDLFSKATYSYMDQ